MNLIFNELSLLPHTDNDHQLKDLFLSLIKTFETGKQAHGFKHIVFPSNISELKVRSNKTFYEWAYGIAHQGDKNKILSIIKKPFVNEVLSENTDELSKYYYVNTEAEANIPETYCSGLATAYIKESLSTGLSSAFFWRTTQIHFYKIINDDFEKEEVSVKNVSSEDDFSINEIQQFIEYLGEIILLKTTIPPEDKPISLRDDHGKDKLLTFSKKIITSEYVLSIINSLPFNPNAVNLIKEIYPDGKIELVLYWEDKGIGIIIQTTGRNYRETEAIAKELKKKFDR